MANRTGTRIPAELKKNPYSQKQKNPQKEFYSEHLNPYYRKGLQPPEELVTQYYDLALDLLLQALELDIRRMMHLVYSEIEKSPHKRDKLLKYARIEKEKIEKEMEEAKIFYASRPRIILLHKNALRNVKGQCMDI